MHIVPLDQLRDCRGAGGWCDGVSLTTDRVICFAPSPRSRRQNFTLLHEFGHFLVNEDDDVLDWLADRPNPAADVERLCDAIAAQILLPDATILRVLDGHKPTPEHLHQLYAASRASEEVCAIALANRLPVRGAVVLIRRRTAAVVFAASNGWPLLHIHRGLVVPQHHPLRDLGIRQRWSGWTTSDLRLAISEPLPDTPIPNLLQAWAEAGANRTTTILLDTLSRKGVAGDAYTRRTNVRSMPYEEMLACPHCGHGSSSNIYPCEECEFPPCRQCGRCQCI
ncbi:ImmA/IrrE family metallo-endopeptidase [Acrocarpospora macrocephala]|uniref:ImmA/IrrE family metallo-endopeptidase n=1 Tax=Acrocarpospora macrocephala TaxID=150177 RepID=UPI0035A221B4